MIRTWSVECYGTITRDIRWVEVDAETEQAAREAVMHAMPRHRVMSVIPSDASSGPSDTTTPANVGGSPEKPNT